MKKLLQFAVLIALISPLAPVHSEAGVGLIDEPTIHADHVEIELTSTGRSGVRTTAADGAWVWSQWLAHDGEVSLTAQPMGAGRPAEVVWHGETGDRDRLTFRVVWPGECPCTVELTDGDDVAMTWSGVEP